MQYALVNNIKSLAEKGKSGTCPGCGRVVVAKCGDLIVHHWAHKQTKDCDSWSEPETEWHRAWKNEFPESYREVVFHDDVTDEYHRADIHTKGGITIEFQNSPITIQELSQRNNFYKKLIWVVNGTNFSKNFKFERQIPNPLDPILRDFEFMGQVFYKKSEIIEQRKSSFPIFRVFGLNSDELRGLNISPLHYSFTWNKKRQVWFESTAAVFLDFGDDFLYWLRQRDQLLNPFWYVQIVKKSSFLSKYVG